MKKFLLSLFGIHTARVYYENDEQRFETGVRVRWFNPFSWITVLVILILAVINFILFAEWDLSVEKSN